MSRRGKRKRDDGVLPELALPDRGVPRRLRVERELHEELVAALGGLADPRVAVATVTRVEMTDDLSFARVWVRAAMRGEEDRDGMMRGLRRASGRIRTHLNHALALRKAPELKFIYDEGFEKAARVEALLDEIASDRTDHDD
jgi:ribosome-binding factor A